MNANTRMAGVMMNTGPLFGPLAGISGGVAALAAIPHPQAKFFTCALMFAAAAGSAMRRHLLAAPAPAELSDYPFDTRSANPWARDGGPLGL